MKGKRAGGRGGGVMNFMRLVQHHLDAHIFSAAMMAISWCPKTKFSQLIVKSTKMDLLTSTDSN